MQLVKIRGFIGERTGNILQSYNERLYPAQRNKKSRERRYTYLYNVITANLQEEALNINHVHGRIQVIDCIKPEVFQNSYELMEYLRFCFFDFRPFQQPVALHAPVLLPLPECRQLSVLPQLRELDKKPDIPLNRVEDSYHLAHRKQKRSLRRAWKR